MAEPRPGGAAWGLSWCSLRLPSIASLTGAVDNYSIIRPVVSVTLPSTLDPIPHARCQPCRAMLPPCPPCSPRSAPTMRSASLEQRSRAIHHPPSTTPAGHRFPRPRRPPARPAEKASAQQGHAIRSPSLDAALRWPHVPGVPVEVVDGDGGLVPARRSHEGARPGDDILPYPVGMLS
jgi:hypothetical protein